MTQYSPSASRNPSSTATTAGMEQVPLKVAPSTRGQKQQGVKRPRVATLSREQLNQVHRQQVALRTCLLQQAGGGDQGWHHTGACVRVGLGGGAGI